MGEYFVIANSTKKEYIAPSDFGENPKSSCFPHSGWIHICAVTMLVCQTGTMLGRNYDPWQHPWGPLAGSWSGDTILTVGDETGGPSDYGLETSPEQQNGLLHDIVIEEYGSISHKVVAMFCQGEWHSGEDDDDFLPAIVKASRTNDSVLLTLGNAVFMADCKPLETELLRQWGPEWVEKYNREFDYRGQWHRLG